MKKKKQTPDKMSLVKQFNVASIVQHSTWFRKKNHLTLKGTKLVLFSVFLTMSSQHPRKVGQYTIKKVIGSGQFGIVHKVTNAAGNDCALKMVYKDNTVSVITHRCRFRGRDRQFSCGQRVFGFTPGLHVLAGEFSSVSLEKHLEVSIKELKRTHYFQLKTGSQEVVWVQTSKRVEHPQRLAQRESNRY